MLSLIHQTHIFEIMKKFRKRTWAPHDWTNVFHFIINRGPYRTYGPPLWSSGHSSWLQILRPGFDSLHYQKKNSRSGTGWTQPREYN
jgi:hypothetical protein